MEPSTPPPPPQRRRRRWVIVASVLVLVSMVSWWYWPRGDARFVGRWAAADELHQDQPHSTFIFWSNGTGMIDEGKVKCLFSWSVSGDTLTLGPNSPQSLRPRLELLARRISSLTNRYLLWDPHPYNIVEMGNDRIVIVSDNIMHARNQILTRIP